MPCCPASPIWLSNARATGRCGDFAEDVLKAGVPLMIASVGALADAALAERLDTAGQTNGARLILPSGAIGGLDLLRAVAAEEAVQVRYQGIKPPVAWKDSPAEDRAVMDSLTEAHVFFEGTGREAAQSFPKNANVVAALALAGAGFDTMRVELIADPAASGNTHRYQVTSPYCNYEMTIENAPSAGNARTSMTTVLSLLQEIRTFAQTTSPMLSD
jgi:aspartate dehydrogenase